MLLADLVEASRQVAATSARLEKIERLADCLRRLAAGPEEIEIGVALLAGEARQGRIGLGPAALREAVATPAAASASLTLAEVDQALERIAGAGGRGSSAERAGLLAGLFARGTTPERDFLVRVVTRELRQGALEGVVVEALARAAGLPASEVRRAVMLAGDLVPVARAALTEGAGGLLRFSLRPLQPVRPMLAQSAEEVEEAIAALERAALEFKMDGARIQVHRVGDEVRVFTRRLNDVTVAVPEIVEAVLGLPDRPLILDGEALAFGADGSPQPFQVTMRRFGRKLDVARMRQSLPLRAFFFDCLHLAGEDLIDRPAEERFRALAEVLPEDLRMPRIVTADPAEAREFLARALERGHEGLMAKSLEAPYEAGSRGRGWLKVKPARTLDLVVLAAEWGHGRRRGWLSNLHLGARDPSSGQIVMLGKTFKGLTDEMLAWQTEQLLAIETSRDAWTVWVAPKLVVEIAVGDVQTSPHYPAGLALRFARVKRFRTDKTPQEADTLDAVRALHARAGRNPSEGFPAPRHPTGGTGNPEIPRR